MVSEGGEVGWTRRGSSGPWWALCNGTGGSKLRLVHAHALQV